MKRNTIQSSTLSSIKKRAEHLNSQLDKWIHNLTTHTTADGQAVTTLFGSERPLCETCDPDGDDSHS